MSTNSSYSVAGMTCAHCVSAVTDELNALRGVEDVTVELRPGGASTVNVASSTPLDVADVRSAIEEAGYRMADEVPGSESAR